MDVKSDMPDIEKARELVSDGRLWPLVRDCLWGADAPCGEGKVFADFSEPGPARIMLLDAATIDKIARWVGVVVYSRQLGAITDGPGVRALKAALPGAYPDVFSFTAYFRNVPAAPKAGEFPRLAPDERVEAVIAAGRSVILGAVCKDCPAPVLAAFTAKLGPAEPVESDSRFISTALKLKFPEAYRLCFS